MLARQLFFLCFGTIFLSGCSDQKKTPKKNIESASLSLEQKTATTKTKEADLKSTTQKNISKTYDDAFDIPVRIKSSPKDVSKNKPAVEESSLSTTIPPQDKSKEQSQKQEAETAQVFVTGRILGLNTPITIKMGEKSQTLYDESAFEFSIDKGSNFTVSAEKYSKLKLCLTSEETYTATEDINSILVVCNDRLTVESYDTRHKNNFSQCLRDQLESDIYIDEIEKIQCSAVINSIENIDHFLQLKHLHLDKSEFLELDLSWHKKIDTLHLPNAKLTSLTLPTGAKLKSLDLENSLLNTLDLSAYTHLERVNLRGSQLDNLNLTGALDLDFLDTRLSKISEPSLPQTIVNLSQDANLVVGIIKGLDTEEVSLTINGITQTQSANSVFEFLIEHNKPFAIRIDAPSEKKFCYSDQPTYTSNEPLTPFAVECKAHIPVETFIKENPNGFGECVKNHKKHSEIPINTLSDITDFSCMIYDDEEEGTISHLDFSDFPNMTDLNFQNPWGAKITTLNFSKNHKLTDLFTMDSHLISLDFSGSHDMKSITLYGTSNDLTSLNISSNNNLTSLFIKDAPKLNNIELPKSGKLDWINLPKHLEYLGDNVISVSGSFDSNGPTGFTLTVFGGSAGSPGSGFTKHEKKGDPMEYTLTSPTGKNCYTIPELPAIMTEDISFTVGCDTIP